MKHSFFITSSLCLLLVSATAQTTKEQPCTKEKTIEVTGESEAEVDPDEIYISVMIRERTDGKKQTVDQQEDSLKAYLKKVNIDVNALTLDEASSNYQKTGIFKKDAVLYKQYTLKVSTPVATYNAFAIFDYLKFEGSYIQRTNYSKLNELKKELRIKAVKAAKEKADYMLGALNKQTGEPIFISEGNAAPITGMYYNRLNGYKDKSITSHANVRFMSESNDDSAIKLNKIKITIDVNAVFEIK